MKANRTKLVTIAATIVLVSAFVVLVLNVTQQDGPTARPESPTGEETPGGDGAVDLRRHVADFTAHLDEDGGYRPPTRTERRAVAESVGLLLDGRRAEATERLSTVDFDLRTVTDSATGRRYAEIADRAEDSAAPRGWGRVYVDLGARAGWSVQVPHPVADEATEQLGVRVLRGTPGGVLVLAGAHRDAGKGNSADAAHRRDTVFHAVCDELTRRGLPGLQLHGFARSTAPDFDVIASTGKGDDARGEGRKLANALRDRGFEVCRAWARDCPLEGRTNMQGRSAAEASVPFLHIEFSRDIRTTPTRAAAVTEALATVTSAWAKEPASGD
ncbi:hypothetical protein [Streptomyces sp. NPDC006368]|uniref:hypothetical protein n=1 Tax=Streptomyces sp. NPDC006368 TaxID=3156760 RepID=UPI0033B755A9